MASFINALLFMLGAIIVENIVFSKLLGVEPMLSLSEKPSKMLGACASTAIVLTVSSVFAWAAHRFILAKLGIEFLETLVFIIIIAALAFALDYAVKKFVPKLADMLGNTLPLVLCNYAVLGALLINAENGYSLAKSAANALACAIGFTLATIIFAGVRARISFAQPPKYFKGAPIAMIAAGLIAMAFSGFSGLKF